LSEIVRPMPPLSTHRPGSCFGSTKKDRPPSGGLFAYSVGATRAGSAGHSTVPLLGMRKKAAKYEPADEAWSESRTTW
jgi:hypothetical protein